MEPNRADFRCGLMAKPWKSQSDQGAVIQFWILGLVLAGAACIFLPLYSLTQPTVYPNPGLAAYTPPPGTRLIPLSRKSDAPELVDLPDEPRAALSAFAQAQTEEKPAKADVRPPARKRPRVDHRDYEQRRLDNAQQWDHGYRDWNNKRALSGGPKSWF
jgi:hypothetical protein